MKRLAIGTHLALILALFLASGAMAQEADPVEIEFTGTVTAVDLELGAFTVETDGGEVFTVIPPEGFDLTSLEVGDVVEVEGTLAEDGSVLAETVVLQEPDEEDPDQEDPEEADEVNYFCRADTTAQHPVAAGIAETYGMEYGQVLAWFCDGGFGFGQIMLALMTQEQTGGSADELLARRAGGEGWGQIWISLDLIGEPDDAVPPGRPETAGPPDWLGQEDGTEGFGPPEGIGPPDGLGPPDTIGPPEGAGPPNANP
jgi:hypothetical protein